MKKRYTLVAVPIALLALLAALVGGASATPSKTGACSGCHDPGTATITVGIGSQTATSITYNVSGSTANGGTQGWGAFTGTTKVGGQYNAGSFTVPKDGKIYSVYWVDKNPSNMAAYAAKSVTAPVPATTTTLAPTTTTTVRATTTTVPASTTTTTARTTTTTVGATTTTTAGPTTTTTVPAVPTFTDVPVNHPYRPAIVDLASRGIIEGYKVLAGNEFRPQNLVTRQQFAKMIALTVGLAVSEADMTTFADVAHVGNQLYPYHFVAVVAQKGITTGFADGTFRPDSNITRAQVVTMVVRALKALEPSALQQPPLGYTGSLGGFDAIHGPSLGVAEYNGLLVGVSGFGPDWDPWKYASRGEVAELLSSAGKN